MTDLELMQVALDALEEMARNFSFSRLGESRLADTTARGKAHEAAEALHARLKQPVPEPFGWYSAEHNEIITNSWYLEQRKNNPSDDSGFSIPLYTTPPQTKHEPVGYYYRGRFSTEKNAPGIGVYGVPVYTAPPQHEQDDGYCQACEGNYCTAKDGCVARDNPPQREWLELTDEEIEQCAVDDGSDDLIFARAIEAKSKEKNDF